MAVDTTVLSMPDSAMVTISAISTGRRCVGRAGPVTAGGVTGAVIPGQLRQTAARADARSRAPWPAGTESATMQQ
jgi:hypothetical protein